MKLYWDKEEGIILNLLWYVVLVICLLYFGTLAIKLKVRDLLWKSSQA
jgi:hypothetical protein